MTIKYTPMKPEHRLKFERWEATRDRTAEFVKLPEADRSAKLAKLRKNDPTFCQAANAELRRHQPSPRK
ncbi:hypothetical protein LBMAG56_43730 [Verrucomicrobiota bacterium]|nr:hypothetical protein LBMAG56_43730 [Verrucomicrobiota bacterium]